MKKMIDGFKVVKGEQVLDEFSYYVDSNNHASISNNGGCLFDGYKLEAEEKWNQIRKDTKLFEVMGFTIVGGVS
ncbi:MAG: hypothetical protein IKE94_12915 [Aeriscardovia sp.]|nr:hypothetical protein [Aeriscardovia sp.]